MVILGAIERRRGPHLGDDRVVPDPGGVGLTNRLLGDGALFVGGEEDHRPVLTACVVTLPVTRGGVVNREEDFENIAIRGHRGIESNLHDFDVAGRAAAHVVVGRIGRPATHIAGLDR